MKREGRQHGLVRTYEMMSTPYNPKRPNNYKLINRALDSPPTAGMFSKVQSKPTNHSKFTGKCNRARCNGCHIHPFAKSKDKTKGSHKRRANDVVANYRLVTWRVVDDGPGLNFDGFSATDILNHLAARDYVDGDGFGHDDSYVDGDGFGHDDDSEYLWHLGSNCGSLPPYNYNDDAINNSDCIKVGGGSYSSGVEIDEIVDDGDDDDDRDDDGMSFCDVGYIVEFIEGDEEGWCFVDEM